MSEAFDVVVTTRKGAHLAATSAYQHASQIVADGKRARIVAEEDEDDRTIQQNRFYWGPCLGDIEDQARINGQRWTREAWHQLFKRMFLGYEIKKVAVAGRKRKTVIRSLKSTTGLKVRPMAKYLTELQAFAAVDLGVQFSVQKWEEFR